MSAHVIIRLITAPGMFTYLFLVLLLPFADPPVPKFLFTFKKKKTREKSWKRLDIVQFGIWRDSSMLYTLIEHALSTSDSVRYIRTLS